jgi:hypothetical protein
MNFWGLLLQAGAATSGLSSQDCIESPAVGSSYGAADTQGSVCGIQVAWEAAQSRCGRDLVYSIHRDTSADFTPDPSNRIASCLTTSSWLDEDVIQGQQYFYRLKVEDAAPAATSSACGLGNAAEYHGPKAGRTFGPEIVLLRDDANDDSIWTATGSGSGSDFALRYVGGDFGSVWHVPDPEQPSERLLTLTESVALPASSRVRFEFEHRYLTGFDGDGGVLEYFSNGSWHDILEGDGATIPPDPDRLGSYGYDGVIQSNVSPLAGRLAWSYSSHGDYLPTSVDLTSMSEREISLRFRYASGEFTSEGEPCCKGWDLDFMRIVHSAGCARAADVRLFRDSFEALEVGAH